MPLARQLVPLATLLAAALTLPQALPAQASQKPIPLPPNYRTTFDNADLLVMKVHYGAHEFVPEHDHTAYPTAFVYLNDSGPADIRHPPPNAFVTQRPPTHTGAWRLAPGVFERHSIQSQSDAPSDFLRVEFKRLPADALRKVVRGDAAPPTFAGTRTEYASSALEITRTVCPPAAPCELPALTTRSVLVAIAPTRFERNGASHFLAAGDTVFLPANAPAAHLAPAAQALRIVLCYPQ